MSVFGLKKGYGEKSNNVCIGPRKIANVRSPMSIYAITSRFLCSKHTQNRHSTPLYLAGTNLRLRRHVRVEAASEDTSGVQNVDEHYTLL